MLLFLHQIQTNIGHPFCTVINHYILVTMQGDQDSTKNGRTSTQVLEEKKKRHEQVAKEVEKRCLVERTVDVLPFVW